MDTLTIHGSTAGDQRILQNGLNVMTLQTGGGNIGGMVPNQSGAQEVAVDTDATSAERQTSGVTVNYIQRDGGNTFKSYSFFTYSNENLTSSNLSDRVKSGPYGAAGRSAERDGVDRDQQREDELGSEPQLRRADQEGQDLVLLRAAVSARRRTTRPGCSRTRTRSTSASSPTCRRGRSRSRPTATGTTRSCGSRGRRPEEQVRGDVGPAGQVRVPGPNCVGATRATEAAPGLSVPDAAADPRASGSRRSPAACWWRRWPCTGPSGGATWTCGPGRVAPVAVVRRGVRSVLPDVGVRDVPAGDRQRRAERGERPGGEPDVSRPGRHVPTTTGCRATTIAGRCPT